MANKERVQLLVNALRSGEYTQGFGQLHQPQRSAYCCLGVACDIYRKETGDGVWNGSNFVSQGQFSFTALPQNVGDWFGFDFTNPIILGDRSAAGQNDSGVSFKRIADMFETTFIGKAEA